LSKKQIGILIAVAAVVAFAVILYINSLAPEKPRIFISVMWAKYFNNTRDLTNFSQLIIVGEVSGIRRVIKTDPSTLFEIKVLDVIKKPGWFSNSTITFLQAGAETDDAFKEVSDDPLMHVGEKFVLFLIQSQNYTGTEQWGNLGPLGKYMVREGKVYSLDLIYPDRYHGSAIPIRVNGIPLSEFTETIRTFMRETE